MKAHVWVMLKTHSPRSARPNHPARPSLTRPQQSKGSPPRQILRPSTRRRDKARSRKRNRKNRPRSPNQPSNRRIPLRNPRVKSVAFVGAPGQPLCDCEAIDAPVRRPHCKIEATHAGGLPNNPSGPAVVLVGAPACCARPTTSLQNRSYTRRRTPQQSEWPRRCPRRGAGLLRPSDDLAAKSKLRTPADSPTIRASPPLSS